MMGDNRTGRIERLARRLNNSADNLADVLAEEGLDVIEYVGLPVETPAPLSVERPSNIPEGSMPVVCWVEPSTDVSVTVLSPTGSGLSVIRRDSDNTYGIPITPQRHRVWFEASEDEINEWYNFATSLDNAMGRRIAQALHYEWKRITAKRAEQAEGDAG